jgi:hypothetical protein
MNLKTGVIRMQWGVVVLFVAAAVCQPGGFSAQAAPPVTVKAWIKEGTPKEYATRLVEHLDGFPSASEVQRDRFGGWLTAQPLAATGYFRTARAGRRWWLVDPDGYRFLHIAVCSVSIQSGPQFQAAFPNRFRDQPDWAQQTCDLLRTYGFNGTGCWSDDPGLSTARPRPVYTRRLYFMGSFGSKLGITYQVPGHLGYPDQLIPVFHPDFPAHCETIAQELEETRDDPYLLGIFSDNEMQLPTTSLDRHLKLAAESHGRQAAEAWLQERHGLRPGDQPITDGDRQAWIGHVVDRYLSIVGQAIRRHDPNHLFLGPRFHGADKSREALWKAAGRHLDVVAVNVYGTWSPLEDARRWSDWAGRPFLVTEFYAMGQDSGMKNLTGAGWTVPTQSDRGRFYQNFVLDLIESGGCVGWHYFKYADNDPTDPRAEPSNRDSNKGLVNVRYEPYTPMLDLMQQVNLQAYPLTDYFDGAEN